MDIGFYMFSLFFLLWVVVFLWPCPHESWALFFFINCDSCSCAGRVYFPSRPLQAQRSPSMVTSINLMHRQASRSHKRLVSNIRRSSPLGLVQLVIISRSQMLVVLPVNQNIFFSSKKSICMNRRGDAKSNNHYDTD